MDAQSNYRSKVYSLMKTLNGRKRDSTIIVTPLGTYTGSNDNRIVLLV